MSHIIWLALGNIVERKTQKIILPPGYCKLYLVRHNMEYNRILALVVYYLYIFF